MDRTGRCLLALAASVAIALAACSGGRGSPAGTGPAATPVNVAPSGSPAGTASPPPATAHLGKVAIAYDLAGRGSGGFNDLAYNGARRAADELGVELKEITAKASDTDADREERLTLLADAGYNPIIAVGFTYAAALDTVAPRFPNVRFAIVDDGTVVQPNVTGILFTEEQGSFLVGVAAALTSRTHKVGFVGAVQIPLLQRFEAGFTAGARAADPAVGVQVAYLSQPPDYDGFSDPAKGKEAALGMFDAGADVVFAAAGDSGVGVIQAARETHNWAIGVNSDQYATSDPSIRDAVLTSMLKNADVGTYGFVMDVAAGRAKGGIDTFDLARGGVGYATSGGFIDAIRDRIDAFADRIRSGAIVVPTEP